LGLKKANFFGSIRWLAKPTVGGSAEQYVARSIETHIAMTRRGVL
jgi:hypothetical protein